MAASNEFPRGWTATDDGGDDITVSITIPASPGIIHVLDSFIAKLFNISTAIADYEKVLRVSTSDGAYANFVIARFFANGNLTQDEETGSNLNLASGPGASLTVAFDSANVGAHEFLLIQGHDI